MGERERRWRLTSLACVLTGTAQVIFHPRVDDRDVNTAHSISRSLFYMGGRDYGQHGMSAIAMRPLDGNQRPWPFKY